MITVEKQVNDVLAQLPTVGGFQPAYAWGNEDQLNVYLSRNPNAYPLIYQTSKRESIYTTNEPIQTDWSAVVAVVNDNKDLINDERWQISYKDYLDPLAKNILTAFEYAGFIIVDSRVDIERYPNEKLESMEVWDALTIRCSLIIEPHPIRTIYVD